MNAGMMLEEKGMKASKVLPQDKMRVKHQVYGSLLKSTLRRQGLMLQVKKSKMPFSKKLS